MNASGIIFSNLHDRELSELTRVRTMASIPFGCRYRLIDFPLSNMVNAGIFDISVITHYNYHSLMNHIGSGKDWDLARRTGGVNILPPYITAYANQVNSLYNTRLEALKSVQHSVYALESDYVVLCDCGIVANLDIRTILDRHIASGADITMAVKEVEGEHSCTDHTEVIFADLDGNVTDVCKNGPHLHGKRYTSMNVWVIGRSFLCALLIDAVSHNYVSFHRDIIQRNIGHIKMKIHAVDCPVFFIRSFYDYCQASLALVRDSESRHALFSLSSRPIYTKVQNSPPTVYGENCSLRNALIADGCTVLGKVENSILFRGVRIERGATVRNSIVFANSVIGEGATLDCVVTDKNATIRQGRDLRGCESRPYYIEKGSML